MHWSARARLSQDSVLELLVPGKDGREVAMDPLTVPPAVLLTAAVASCFAKSCHAVLEARGEAASEVLVDVTSEKASDKPSRVARVSIQYRLPALTAEHAARIARDAKRICTVTNSMNSEFDVKG